MRILHTADWHLGRTLEGRSRLEEQAQVLDEIISIIEAEKVDVVLMAGDVFDTVNPPAAAEKLFYESISRMTNGGNRPVFVIAGNHDNPDRISAASPLADEQGITLLGYPDMNPIKRFIPSCNETLKLAALPYPSESRLKEMLSHSHEELLMREKYDERVAGIFDSITSGFGMDTVNIAMSHIYVTGSKATDSERPIQVGGAYTVAAESLPANVQYTALGHLHRPQDVKRAIQPARYSGSPLAYSFSEAGYTKSVTIVDVKPGEVAAIREIPLSSGKPLVRWKADQGVGQVYQWLDEGRDINAWIDLEIHLKNALSIEEIHRLRGLRDGFIHIRPIFTELEQERREAVNASLPIDQLFKRFYERQMNGAVPEDELVELFLELASADEDHEEGAQ